MARNRASDVSVADWQSQTRRDAVFLSGENPLKYSSLHTNEQ